MDDFDDLEKRIQLERELRIAKNNKAIADLLAKQKEEISLLGDGPGVTHLHKKQMEALHEDLKARNQIDEQRYQGYRDDLENGTYMAPDLFPDKAAQLKEAEIHVKALFNVYQAKIPSDQVENLKNEFGKDVIEDVYAKWIVDANKKEKQQQEKKIELDHTIDLANEFIQEQKEKSKNLEQSQILYNKLLEQQKLLRQRNQLGQDQGMSM